MATEPTRRTPGGTRSDLESEERRGWLSHGIAALAVSALGLAVAGSVVVTTNAQTRTAQTGLPAQETLVQGPTGISARTGLPGTLPGVGRAPAAANSPALASFTRRSEETEDESRTAVREAVVEERAAQRSEDLTESAEDIAAAAVKRGSEARKSELDKADRERRLAAIKAAQERTRKAIRARVAAEVERELAAERERAAREQAAKEQAAREQAAREQSGNEQSGTEQDGNQQNSNQDSSEQSGNEQSGNEQAETTPSDRAPDTSNIPSGGGAASPVPGAVVGASFGATGAWARYHTGLDFRAGFGTPIKAVTGGVVTYAGSKGNWAGNHVAIRHAGGYSSMSSHMQTISVRVGQSVQAGDTIGYVGSTGRSFGAHLHFEIYPPGVTPGDVYRAINPINWLRNQGVNTN